MDIVDHTENLDAAGGFDAPVAQADAALFRREEDVCVCLACAHGCRLAPGKAGVCRVRFNRGGVVYAPDGYVAGLQVDPIEKKPFYHVLPGANALSFGMFGCNFQCDFCQNWQSSQMPRTQQSGAGVHPISADSLVGMAVQEGAPVMVSTYNEPLISADWAARVFEKAHAQGLLTGFVSNGFASPEVVVFLRPAMNLFKIDLKCFSDAGYRSLGGRLKPVLDTIERAVAAGFWVEVVTLVVPGFNDSAADLAGMAQFLAGVSRDIPWHVTAFRPAYRRNDCSPTTLAHLERAYDTGKSAGLRYVYMGNMAGQTEGREHTWCHQCGALLIERLGFRVLHNRLAAGTCPDCGTAIPGRWSVKFPA